MDCVDIRFSKHVQRRAYRRRIRLTEVLSVVRTGEVIEFYPDDDPWPESVVLGSIAGRPVHVVVGQEPETGRCVIITVYWPGDDRWLAGFRERRQQ